MWSFTSRKSTAVVPATSSVAQAFCEADLLDRGEAESDEHFDPRGIAS